MGGSVGGGGGGVCVCPRGRGHRLCRRSIPRAPRSPRAPVPPAAGGGGVFVGGKLWLLRPRSGEPAAGGPGGGGGGPGWGARGRARGEAGEAGPAPGGEGEEGERGGAGAEGGVSPGGGEMRGGGFTLQVLHSDVADVPDELLALEPVPLLPGHGDRGGRPPAPGVGAR